MIVNPTAKNTLPPLIVILGPTASGKTELALHLAKKFSGFVISADSRQIYQGMDIGTSKPEGKLKKIKGEKVFFVQDIPHFMIDIIPPDREFTLADYQKQVYKILATNYQLPATSQKLPFLVGGTGLYISAIVDNYQLPQGKIDKKLRDKLNNKTNKELLQKLKQLDPATYIVIDKNNKRRLVRALEYVITNKQSFVRAQKKDSPLFNTLQIGIKIDREKLYQRIDRRVHQMIKTGLIDEVKKLLKKYPADLPAFDSIGYREIIDYLQGKIDLDRAIELIKQNTRHYAKRQLTWFKRDKRIHWIENYRQAEKLIKKFISHH